MMKNSYLETEILCGKVLTPAAKEPDKKKEAHKTGENTRLVRRLITPPDMAPTYFRSTLESGAFLESYATRFLLSQPLKTIAQAFLLKRCWFIIFSQNSS